LWLDRNRFNPDKEYYLRVHTKRTLCRLNTIQLKVVEDRTEETTDIGMNDIFTAKVETLNDVVALPFVESKGLGGLILIDPITNATVAVGTISTVNENPRNLTKYDFSITPKLRAELKNQTAMTIWFTGLSGSGKSYTSDLLEKTLYQEGFHTMTLDGDSLRSTINQDLGFTIEDRIKNIRRTSQIAKILNDAGIIVLVSLISPLKEERAEAKRIIGDNKFIEAFVDTPLELCMERDTKGLYQKALKGEITNFTGVDSPYEAPENPDIVIQPSDDIIQKIKLIVELMKKGEH
jgi:bifunctional enzyme CysN/CysC